MGSVVVGWVGIGVGLVRPGRAVGLGQIGAVGVGWYQGRSGWTGAGGWVGAGRGGWGVIGVGLVGPGQAVGLGQVGVGGVGSG